MRISLVFSSWHGRANGFTGHINNLYNTTFWALVQQGGMTTQEAEGTLKVIDIWPLLQISATHPADKEIVGNPLERQERNPFFAFQDQLRQRA